MENNFQKEIPEAAIARNSFSKSLATVALLVVFCLLTYKGVIYYIDTGKIKEIEKKNQNILSSILSNDPKGLQDSLVQDLKDGVNDKYSKSDAYFITHRFFDNGGDIYEIYDYVNAHPELVFLKEAEAIYPATFSLIKNKDPNLTYNESLYAYLAYVEVLMKHGYSDVAAVSTAANQYAKAAYFARIISNEMFDKKAAAVHAQNVERDTKKAVELMDLAQKDVVKVLNGELTSEDVTPRDILVGLNQYGSALRYLQALGVNYNSPKTSKEVFDYSMSYSRKNVPELNMFTSLVNASTLAIATSSTSTEIKVALYPILDLDKKTVDRLNAQYPTSILKKIIDTRLEQKPKFYADTNLDIYGKRNTTRLARKVPEFKAWLIMNGWVDSDFPALVTSKK